MNADNYKLQITNYKSHETFYLAILTACISVAAFVYYYRAGALLLYGDAVAHINIARRVFDSRDPGPLQLGTVWLPLPHILILPFIVSRWMWRTGVGGAIPSMIAFVAGAIGLFRLVRCGLDYAGAAAGPARAAAWFAALVFVANPNLLYLQATAMTEPLYLALFIWATVFFSEFVQQVRLGDTRARRSLRNSGILLLLCMLTRYDGWFAGAVFAVAGVLTLRAMPGKVTTKVGLRRFVLLLVAVPVVWLVYNAALWGSPLEFATGPYSAKAIEQRSATASMPHHPGYHSIKVAALYLLKDAKLNVADGQWQIVWLVLAAIGSVLLFLFVRRLWPLLLLWLPLPFYALSISRGGVPIFFPDWYPFSFYNVRYGLQLLPAVAVALAILVYLLVEGALSRTLRSAALVVALAFVGFSYASIWRAPLCLREARANSATRTVFERKLADELLRLPANTTVLMYIGDHGGALQMADIPLRRTINETTHPFWKEALANPATAEYAVGFDHDQVAAAIEAHAAEFERIAVVKNAEGASAVIYRRR